MKELEIIYQNDGGIAFYWNNKRDQVQVVFREIGFSLNLSELKNFQEQVNTSLSQRCCDQCKTKSSCRSLLLKTPFEKIDLAVSREDLLNLNDLFGATILKLEIEEYLQFSVN